MLGLVIISILVLSGCEKCTTERKTFNPTGCERPMEDGGVGNYCPNENCQPICMQFCLKRGGGWDYDYSEYRYIAWQGHNCICSCKREVC